MAEVRRVGDATGTSAVQALAGETALGTGTLLLDPSALDFADDHGSDVESDD